MIGPGNPAQFESPPAAFQPVLGGDGYLNQPSVMHYLRAAWAPLPRSPERQISVYGGCDDERTQTEQSIQEMEAARLATISPRYGYASEFGDLSGMTSDFIVGGIMSNGPAFYRQVGGFNTLRLELHQGLRRTSGRVAIVATDHTDTGAEERASRNGDLIEVELTPGGFYPYGDAPIGCAGAGALGPIIASQGGVEEIIYSNINHPQSLGMTNIDLLLRAGEVAGQAYAADRELKQAKDFAVGRQDLTALTEQDIPIMVLNGGLHADPDTTAFLFSAMRTHVRSTQRAHRRRSPVYGGDLGLILEAAAHSKTLRRYEVNPRYIAAASMARAASTRQALEAHSARPGARIPVGFIGNLGVTVAEIIRETKTQF